MKVLTEYQISKMSVSYIANLRYFTVSHSNILHFQSTAKVQYPHNGVGLKKKMAYRISSVFLLLPLKTKSMSSINFTGKLGSVSQSVFKSSIAATGNVTLGTAITWLM